VIRLSIEAQSTNNPEMRVPSETDPALIAIADQLEHITEVSQYTVDSSCIVYLHFFEKQCRLLRQVCCVLDTSLRTLFKLPTNLVVA